MYLDGRKQKISFVLVFFQKGEKKKSLRNQKRIWGSSLEELYSTAKRKRKKTQKKQKTEIVQFDLVMSY